MSENHKPYDWRTAMDKLDARFEQKAPSELPPSETQGRCERSRLATCSLPVSSAERLICRWESEADTCASAARDYERNAEPARSRQAQDRAYAFAQCAKELRAEMEAANSRQPRENKVDMPKCNP